MAAGIKGPRPREVIAPTPPANRDPALTKDLQAMTLRVLGHTRKSLNETAKIGGASVAKALQPVIQAVNQEVERRAAAAKLSPKEFEKWITKDMIALGGWG